MEIRAKEEFNDESIRETFRTLKPLCVQILDQKVGKTAEILIIAQLYYTIVWVLLASPKMMTNYSWILLIFYLLLIQWRGEICPFTTHDYLY
jgi:hypothetical protein